MNDKHPIPDAALAQHIAILAKTGAGKSYLAQGIAERLLDRGERVCVIDPTGRWWGLRANAAGTGPGYPVVVFGGAHADVPLGPLHGEALAEIIGTSNTPAILDTRTMSVSDRTRFFTDFAEGLLRKNKGPLHVIIDEAHLFAPQGRVPDPQSGKMLHAANNLVSLGRGVGLRIVLISQRPAKLHKDSLTQVETLVALRLIAPQDRRAVEDWIGEWADPKQGAELLASLPSLKTGSGWVWAPELNILKHAEFPRIKTYDSGKAPVDGDGDGPVLAPVDLPAIQARLGKVAEDAKANDPKALKAKVAQLERALADAAKNRGTIDAGELQRAVAQAREGGIADGRKAALQAVGRFAGDLANSVERAAKACADSQALLQSFALFVQTQADAAPAARPQIRLAPSPRRDPPPTVTVGDGERLPPGEKAILIALAQYPEGCERDQLSILTGYKRSSRDAYISRLAAKGYAEVAGIINATPSGIAALGDDYKPLPSGEALQDYWRDRLPPGERAVLEVAVQAYPNAIARESIDAATDYKRSSRDAYISRLVARRLVEAVGRGEIKASDVLFS